MGPVMVSTWVQPINLTVNSKFGSRLFEGAGVSAIEYATNLYLVIAGVFILSITNVIFPKISPAVIVAVTDGEKLLLTRYADRPYRGPALIAGFVEVGETLEDTVRREALE